VYVELSARPDLQDKLIPAHVDASDLSPDSTGVDQLTDDITNSLDMHDSHTGSGLVGKFRSSLKKKISIKGMSGLVKTPVKRRTEDVVGEKVEQTEEVSGWNVRNVKFIDVARIWCEEGHETKKKQFMSDIQKYYEIHAINSDKAIFVLGRQPGPLSRSSAYKLEEHSQQGLVKDRNHPGGVEVAAQNRSEWRRSVAQCIHLDAGWIKVKVKATTWSPMSEFEVTWQIKQLEVDP